ncbi:hypothetical protein ACJX0J_014759, partial [Zea mays]
SFTCDPWFIHTLYVGFETTFNSNIISYKKPGRASPKSHVYRSIRKARPPPVHCSKPSRTDRNRNYRGNYQDGPPQQGNYQNNRPPPQGGYHLPEQPAAARKLPDIPLAARWKRLCPHSRIMHKVVMMVEVLEGRNDYTDRSGYNGPPDFRSQSQYQGHVNPAGQGQGYNNPQE